MARASLAVRFALAGMVLAGIGSTARADQFVAKNIPYPDVRIVEIRDLDRPLPMLVYEAGGREGTKPLEEVTKMVIDDEPAFNAAEAAFRANKWSDAVAGYEKAKAATQKAWLKSYCTMRGMKAAGQVTDDFVMVVRSFINAAKTDAKQARQTKFSNVPKAGSKFLDDAEKMLRAALAESKSDATTAALLEKLGDVLTAGNKAQDAEKVAEQLQDVERRLNPNSAAALSAQLQTKLKIAATALASKEYDKAEKAIMEVGAQITDPSQQASALFVLAEAKAGMAAAKTDAETWKDVAIAYMRVVACAPQSDRASDALLRTAGIIAKQIGDKPAAAQLYRDLAAQYPNTPTATEAQKALAELEKDLPKK